MQHGRIDLNIKNAFSPALQVGGCPGEAARCAIVPSHSNVHSKLTIFPAFTYVNSIASQATLQCSTGSSRRSAIAPARALRLARSVPRAIFVVVFLVMLECGCER